MAEETDNSNDFHIQFMMRQIGRLQELRKEGKVNIEVTIDHLEMLMLQNIALDLHMKRLEEAVGNALNFTSLLTLAAKPSKQKPKVKKEKPNASAI